MSINDLLIEAISKRKLISNTDPGRIFRSKAHVRTRPPKVTELGDDNIEFIEYNVKAFPSTENKRHYGFIVYDNNKKMINEAYCTCKDFCFSNVRTWQSKKLLNVDKIPKKYLDHTSSFPTRASARIRNPRNIPFLCKHLAAIMSGYLD
jgi:hypothetical protein